MTLAAVHLRSGIFCSALLLTSSAAWSRLPEQYGAIVVTAPALASPAADNVRQFDLRPAIERARAAGKPILMYFGAFDCPYCKLLERTFAQHQELLAPKFRKKYVIIEIDGWLRGARMEFVTAEGQFRLGAFRERIGDDSPQFLWPSWYQLDNNLKITRTLPPGANEYREPDAIELIFGL